MKPFISQIKKWIKRGLMILLGVLVVTAVSGALVRTNLRAKNPPPGQMVDVGGFEMHIYCQGEGSPTVILEAGQGNMGLIWSPVQAEVAQTTRVCMYDRAGLGWSEMGPEPRTARQVVAELHTLLAKAEIEGPYVLVGHSVGGLFTRLYSHQYPQEVAGMVLVDSVHEDRFVRGPAEETEMLRDIIKVMPLFYGVQKAWTYTGIPALLPTTVDNSLSLSPETAETYQNVMKAHPRYISGVSVEVAALEAYYDEVNAARIVELSDLPLVVISHGRPVAYAGVAPETNQIFESAWQQFQVELAAQSTNGQLIIAADSGHNIQLDQPELVIDAIVQVVNIAQGQLAVAGQ
ncbi:MAG: alpha/beta hydrolase [Anaerolineaceae bacterium]|nr:alpha/beta hydrolase [Anaerolineaceae bacterium]